MGEIYAKINCMHKILFDKVYLINPTKENNKAKINLLNHAHENINLY